MTERILPVKVKRPQVALEEKHYRPIRGLRAWLRRQKGKYRFCPKCLVVREVQAHREHTWIHEL